METANFLDLERFDILLTWFGPNLRRRRLRSRHDAGVSPDDKRQAANKKGMVWIKKYLFPAMPRNAKKW